LYVPSNPRFNSERERVPVLPQHEGHRGVCVRLTTMRLGCRKTKKYFGKGNSKQGYFYIRDGLKLFFEKDEKSAECALYDRSVVGNLLHIEITKAEMVLWSG